MLASVPLLEAELLLPLRVTLLRFGDGSIDSVDPSCGVIVPLGGELFEELSFGVSVLALLIGIGRNLSSSSGRKGSSSAIEGRSRSTSTSCSGAETSGAAGACAASDGGV